ncbi:MAG: NAD(P)H-hydrate epimerase [Anaerovoracaceae bacterium]|nr:NAD(P)H-hydrate epimerase [Anaerovoracaceae bacterium]
MTRAVSVETMRISDKYTIDNLVPSKELMYRAGKGLFEAFDGWKSPVLIACGKGNNAGDGYVVAGLLLDRGIDVSLALVADKFSEDGRYYYDKVKDRVTETFIYEERQDLSGYAVIVDCILGTGFSGDVRGTAKSMIEAINAAGAAGTYVISCDINSGLNGDTGEGVTYVKSDLTVSIGEFKLGHFRGLAEEAMKAKVNVDIGIEIIGEVLEI